MNEAKRLTGYSYKLMGLGNIPGLPAQEQANQFGLDVSFGPDDLEIDENEMSCVIPFADGNRVDGSGDVIEVAGIRTERHRANPIVLFDHGKQVTLPVALSEDPTTKLYTVEIDPIAKKAKGKAFFYQGKWGGKNFNGATEYDHALFCEQLFDLLAKRYIRAGSIGYQVMKGLPMQGTYGMGIPQGVHLQEVNMLEYSAVVLPCNQDTVGKALSLKRVCGKPLSTHLVKSLSPYAPARKAQMGYERKASQEGLDLEHNRPLPTPRYREGQTYLGTSMPEIQEAYGDNDDADLPRGRGVPTEPGVVGTTQTLDAQLKREREERLRNQAGEKSLKDKTQQKIDKEQAVRDLLSKLSEQSEMGGGVAKFDAPYEVRMAKEPMQNIRNLSMKQKSFSALLKSLREKYRKNYDMEELEGNMKSHHKDDPYDLDSQRIQSREAGSGSWFPDDGDMDEVFNEVLDKIPGLAIPEHPHGFGDEKALPVQQGESLFSIGSSVDLKKLSEAISFLKSMASEGFSLDETGRAKCYHYAKSLMPYGRKGDFSKTERMPKGSPSSTQEDRLSFLELHASPKETHYDSQGLSVGDAGYSRDRGIPLPSQEVMQRYQGPNPVAEAMPTPRPSREHDNFYQDVISGGVEQEIHQTPQVYPQEIPDWHNDPLYLKSLERIIKMALPHDYEVGREVVHSFPPQQAGESELHLRPSQSMRTAPRETTDHPDAARVVYGDGSEGLRFLHNFTYASELPNPPQEEDE